MTLCGNEAYSLDIFHEIHHKGIFMRYVVMGFLWVSFDFCGHCGLLRWWQVVRQMPGSLFFFSWPGGKFGTLMYPSSIASLCKIQSFQSFFVKLDTLHLHINFLPPPFMMAITEYLTTFSPSLVPKVLTGILNPQWQRMRIWWPCMQVDEACSSFLPKVGTAL